jgi:hypothetical protein
MLKVTLEELAGLKTAVKAMRNPKNSWDRSDSYETFVVDTETLRSVPSEFFLGDNDLKLMQNLTSAGVEHRTFARMVQVWVTIDAPFYWWKEMDRYTVGKNQIGCSTMHKIHDKEFTLDDFSCDHLHMKSLSTMGVVIQLLNFYRNKFIAHKDKEHWWQMIQLLPSSYNQTRTVNMSYEVCMKIWKERHTHKLDEWHTLCDFILDLPYMKDIMKMTSEDGE